MPRHKSPFLESTFRLTWNCPFVSWLAKLRN
jgi:hypothetical protein